MNNQNLLKKYMCETFIHQLLDYSPLLLKLDTIEDFEVEGELIYKYINNPEHTLKRLKENVMIPSELFIKKIYESNQENFK